MKRILILDKQELINTHLPRVINRIDLTNDDWKKVYKDINSIKELLEHLKNKNDNHVHLLLNEGEELPEYLIYDEVTNTVKPMTDLLERKMKIEKGIITLETEKDKARQMRDKEFIALDLYDKAVLREDILETEKDKDDRDKFRNEWLELPNNYSDLDTPIEDLYPKTPEKIKYFE